MLAFLTLMALTARASIFLGFSLYPDLISSVDQCIYIERFNHGTEPIPAHPPVFQLSAVKAVGVDRDDCIDQYDDSTDVIPATYIYVNEHSGHTESETNESYHELYGSEAARY
jgi:hypothetical protein